MPQNVITFIGAGKVAGALCRELYGSGCKINTIISQTPEKGMLLAEACRAQWSPQLKILPATTIVLVAVPDHELTGVLDSLKIPEDILVAHTSGSSGMDVFPGHIVRKGVFYPLQTFSAGREVDFSGLPVLIESTDERSTLQLRDLAEGIGSRVYYADSEHRRWLHLAAVFACNFTNHLLTLTRDIAAKGGFEMDILEPLIRETFNKALEDGPERSQTGPAVRNDFNTIEKHLELLSFSPDLQKIYNDLTLAVINYYKKKL